jgi:hypothetical protein
MSLKDNIYVLSKVVSKESPTLLIICGVSGFLTSLALVHNAGIKAARLIDDTEVYYNKELTKKEMLELTWKCYIPSVISSTVTLACFLGAHSINLKRNAAIAGLYTITEASLKEYKAKVIETIGEKKEEKLRGEIDQARLLANPLESDSQVIITGNGETLFYDSLSGRYFKNNYDTVNRLLNEFNRDLMIQNSMSLNEFYHLIGLMHTEMGRNTGWDIEYGLITILYSAKITSDGKPCIVMNFDPNPRPI